MRATILTAALVCLLSAPALAKDPPPPASRPADVQQQIADLRDQLRQLADLVRELRAEVAALKPSAPAAGGGGDDVEAAVKAGKVIVGMSKAQARGVLDKHGWTTAIHRTEDMSGGKRVRRESWIVNENNAVGGAYPNKIQLTDDVVTRVE